MPAKPRGEMTQHELVVSLLEDGPLPYRDLQKKLGFNGATLSPVLTVLRKKGVIYLEATHQKTRRWALTPFPESEPPRALILVKPVAYDPVNEIYPPERPTLAWGCERVKGWRFPMPPLPMEVEK